MCVTRTRTNPCLYRDYPAIKSVCVTRECGLILWHKPGINKPSLSRIQSELKSARVTGVLETKRDINQEDLKIVDPRFVKFE